MLKAFFHYVLERMRMRRALNTLAKDSKWSIDFIVYLLKTLPDNFKYIRRTVNKDGTVVEDIITKAELVGIDYKQRELELAHDYEQIVLDNMYKELL